MTEQLVFFFGEGKADGDAKMKHTLGGKGANLAEMTNLGIPVPPGFTISTDCCGYVSKNKTWPKGLDKMVRTALARLEKVAGRKFGDARDPLLVSVRSGAASSMPGMMDTVLNLGLSPQSVKGLAKKTGNPRLAWDSYRRFVNMFGNVVCGVSHELFEEAMAAVKAQHGAQKDLDLDAAAMEDLAKRYLKIFEKATGEAFPSDPWEQLQRAINAVFQSWDNERAVTYRRLNKITGLRGTAVNVQTMVFGNYGDTSATGVCFTRDPSTGENVFYGEFLPNAQGEDVVAGIRTPLPIADIDKHIPGTYEKLIGIKHQLEEHYHDVQDIEFTVQEGELFMLQTRTGKRTGKAAVRIAVEMVKEKLISKKDAIRQVDPAALDQLLHPDFDPHCERKEIGKGLPASPGAASGRIYFSAEDAEAAAARSEAVILVRHETSPEDIGGMHVSKGILTSRGGMTSHAAVVARGMGTCCVAGCGEISIDDKNKTMTSRGITLKEGDWISLDGSLGKVYEGKLPTIDPQFSKEFETLMGWADEKRRLKVRTNADTPKDCEVARRFGAQGIGLCRTEHMFFDEARIMAVREMIVAANKEQRRAALDKLLPHQRSDFIGIFKAMDGLPVTIRLLDPPLHEFLPLTEESQAEVAKSMGVKVDVIRRKVSELHEINPMLGHRGCRLGLTHPEIYEMQVRAIVEAVAACEQEGVKVLPEIMHPLVATRTELTQLRAMTERVIEEVRQESGLKADILIGTMIEVPRAALTADEIAEEADFFSFGTNDLTQMTFGFSRDDTGPILIHYQTTGILDVDPFACLDVTGVGQLVRMAVEKGRKTRRSLKCGICGEHGGDPKSIAFCNEVGLDYVSCSPYRVPIARLAAAQASLGQVTATE
ncbi:MAG: pyruvate, phosphate dikinase [Planctomycetes bacterium]|nr:pyruvate, phosphate dikinase [Planctomycetota bacterium]